MLWLAWQWQKVWYLTSQFSVNIEASNLKKSSIAAQSTFFCPSCPPYQQVILLLFPPQPRIESGPPSILFQCFISSVFTYLHFPVFWYLRDYLAQSGKLAALNSDPAF